MVVGNAHGLVRLQDVETACSRCHGSNTRPDTVNQTTVPLSRAMPTAHPRLSIAIQGIEVQVRIGIRDVQALVPRKVLEFSLH